MLRRWIRVGLFGIATCLCVAASSPCVAREDRKEPPAEAARPARPAWMGQGAFSDVPLNSPLYRQVTWLSERGIFTGYPSGTFNGKRALTRYEFAIALQRMMVEVGRLLEGGGNICTLGKDPKTVRRWWTRKGLEACWREGFCLREVTTLQDLTRAFRPELKMLGTDARLASRNLHRLKCRIRVVERRLGPKKLQPRPLLARSAEAQP